MKWYKLPEVQNSDKPFLKKVKAGGKSICLVGYEGKLHAVSATCPHAGGDLSDGWCRNGKLVCPLHRYAYDIETGKGIGDQHDYIDTYPLEVRADGTYVGITSFWEKLKNGFK